MSHEVELERQAVPTPRQSPPGAGSLPWRAVWSFSDQALSSLTNAGLAIVVARGVGQSSFGAFSLALVTFSFVIGISRAVVSDVFVIQFSDASAQVRRDAARGATGGALVLGLVAGLVCLLAGTVLPDHETKMALLALGLSLPGLLVQDCWRFVFFAADRPASAAINDFVWAVAQFTAVGLLLQSGHPSIFLITLAWGGAALLSAGVACWQGGLLPAPGQARTWFVLNRHLNVRMGIDYVLNMGAVNLATYLIGAIVGLVAVGALRAAQVILGPLQLVYSGAAAFLLPVLSRRAGRGQDLRRPALAVTAAVCAVASVWVGVLLALPDRWGAEILGASWDSARSVLVASGVAMIVVAATTGPSLCLRALRRPDLLLRVTLIQSPFILGFGLAGAWLGGVTGAATGLALAQITGAVSIWFLLLRHSRPTFEASPPAVQPATVTSPAAGPVPGYTG